MKFAPGDKVRCLVGCDHEWPLKTGDIYAVALVVIAAFSQKGPVTGIVLDPFPTDLNVSKASSYPYVWDEDKFELFFRPPKPVVRHQPQARLASRPTLEPIGP